MLANAGIERLQGNMPMRLFATLVIAPILAHFSECLPYLLLPSWHKAETELFPEAGPDSKKERPLQSVSNDLLGFPMFF